MFDNVGPMETKLRIVTGLAMMVVGFFAPEQWHLVVQSIAVTVLFPAVFGFCPLKALLFRSLGKPA